MFRNRLRQEHELYKDPGGFPKNLRKQALQLLVCCPKLVKYQIKTQIKAGSKGQWLPSITSCFYPGTANTIKIKTKTKQRLVGRKKELVSL